MRPSRSRALALYGDGILAFWRGARDDLRRRNEEALDAARAAGDPEALALACLGLSRAALSDRDHERARAFAVEARERARPLGPATGQGPLHMHAQSLWLADDLDEAARLFAESLDLNRRLGDRGVVVVELHNLGHVEFRRGRADETERLFDECALLERVGSMRPVPGRGKRPSAPWRRRRSRSSRPDRVERYRFGSGQLNIHCTPNRSRSVPK